MLLCCVIDDDTQSQREYTEVSGRIGPLVAQHMDAENRVTAALQQARTLSEQLDELKSSMTTGQVKWLTQKHEFEANIKALEAKIPVCSRFDVFVDLCL